MAVDHLENGGDLSNADALYDTMAQSLSLVPLAKVKGLSAKLKKDAPVEQMRMPDEGASIIPEAPIKEKKTKSKKGLSVKLEDSTSVPLADNYTVPKYIEE